MRIINRNSERGAILVKHRSYKPRGAVNVSSILGLSVMVLFLTALLWAARMVLVDIELQDAVSAAATAIAANGCWDTQAQNAWGQALRIYPLSMVAKQVTIDSNSTTGYTPYGHVLTIAASVALTPWGGARAGGSSGGLTLHAVRHTISLAPSSPSQACVTQPTPSWWLQWLDQSLQHPNQLST